MIKRNKKLIDKKLQLKVVMKMISITAITFSLVLLFIGHMAFKNDLDITSMINQLQNAVEVEDNIIKAFVDYSKEFTGKNVRLNISNISNDHEKSIASIKQLVGYVKKSALQYKKIIIVIGVIAIFQIFFFCIYIIRFTHRIFGPIFVINRYVQELIDGKNPVPRALRDKDEFKDLYKNIQLLAEIFDQNKI